MKRLLVMCVASVLSISTLAFASSTSENYPTYDNDYISNYSAKALFPPTTLSPDNVHRGNWDDTINFSYTKYYFKPGSFKTSAKTNHRVEFFKADGDALHTQNAVYNSITGLYETNIDNMPFYYYVAIHNVPHGILAEGTSYVATAR